MLSGFLALPLPLPLIVLISVAIPVIVVIPIIRAVSNAHITADGDAGFEGLVALFGFVGTASALLLAFIIVNVQGEQVSAQNTLFGETSTLETVLKETKTFDPKLAPEIKQLVLGYLEEMRQHEIDATAPIGGDPRAEEAFSTLLARFAQLEKDVTADEAQVVFDEVEKLTDLRNSRVDTPPGSLDSVTTAVCVVLALLTAVAMALLPAPRRWVKWVQSLGVAVAVGLVMSLVFYIASDTYTKEAEDQQIQRIESVV